MGAMRHHDEMMDQSESASSDDDVGDNSGSATGTSTSFPDQQSMGEDARRMEIIEREEKRVRKARYALMAVMIICACAVTAAVYISTKNNEYDVFVRKFQVYSTDVIKSAQWQTDYNFRLMQQLSADMTSTVLIQDDVFPNVTHPHFDISAGYADGFGGLLSSVYAPIITDFQQEEWEDYSLSNTWWIDESEELRVDHPGHLYQTHIHYLKTYGGMEDGFDVANMNKHNVSEYIFHYVNGTKEQVPLHSAKSYAPLCDCNVAICGVPTPRVDHAAAMARFATECLSKMNALTKELEAQLGPDTAGLAFRIGLHSGPVTGGVLRGDNARFQLFGDTVNMASRIESTGLPNRIHVSQDTAELLIETSKGHWVTACEDLVSAKGIGLLKTYWLSIKESKSSRSSVSNTNTSSHQEEEEIFSRIEGDTQLEEKSKRLAAWNTEVLFQYLKLVLANRAKSDCSVLQCDDWTAFSSGVTVFEEVIEIIDLPDQPIPPNADCVDSAMLEDGIQEQLYNFVVSIAQLYPSNAFHNFEHASHVMMSVVKLSGRIAPPSDAALSHDDVALRITSDPLVHFACIFAALIHDVEHPGVPNTQLVKEKSPMAETFHGKSVAEQNSVVVAWNLLMQPKYASLRRALCSTLDEVKRFRQLVVNAVMATDVMARDLKVIRDRRWVQAFASAPLQDEEPSVAINRKVTVVIEHLIQASDVCHTMQHWHVYRKWNERLFMEMLPAYSDGRADCNPADTWYQGELGFYDFYIIPLAKKLADCGVFGVSSDEYLNYARKNRDEWEACGEHVVSEMVAKYQSAVQGGPRVWS